MNISDILDHLDGRPRFPPFLEGTVAALDLTAIVLTSAYVWFSNYNKNSSSKLSNK